MQILLKLLISLFLIFIFLPPIEEKMLGGMTDDITMKRQTKIPWHARQQHEEFFYDEEDSEIDADDPKV
jgi:hypothetical protein